MTIIGNILWIILGGLLSALSWAITGLLWCITIIGIPVGVQCFKIAGLSLCPFGKEVRYEGGAVSFIVNVFWFLFGGLFIALSSFVWGVILYITIIGIPFGKQFFKLAKLGLCPFGAEVVKIN